MDSSKIWDNSGITIVVLPSGSQAEQLYTVAREWTALRLLSPSIWVNPEEMQKSAGGPPKVPATVLASNRAGEFREKTLDLFALLATQQLNTVRLLVVRPSVPGSEFDGIQDDFVHVISPYLDVAIPKLPPSKESDGDGIKLVKINLITGPTEHVIEDAKPLMDELFNVHFVPSAEDRSGPRTGDSFIHYEPDSLKFAGFTLLHVATLGGLWIGLPRGGYELAGQAVWEGDSVYVSRVFVSAILTDGLIRRACARVLETVADSRGGIKDLGVGLNIEGTFPIQDSDIEAWLGYMVQLTFNFDDEVLQYKPILESPTPPRIKFSIPMQVVDFFKFAGGKLARVPYYAWLRVLHSVANFFNRVFQRGEKGASEVVVRTDKPDPLDKTLLEKFDQVSESKKLADQALVSPVGRSNLRSTPSLWTSLRKMVFGFLDSSNLSQFGISRSENGWPVFYNVRSIFQDPRETIQIQNPITNETAKFGWGQAAEGTDYLRQFSSSHLQLKQDLQTELAAIVEEKAKLQDLKNLLAFHSEKSSEETNLIGISETEKVASGEV